MSEGTFRNDAPRYWQQGYSVLPQERGAKRPAREIVGWSGYVNGPASAATQEDWLNHFGDRGILLMLGTEVAPDLQIAGVDVDDDGFVRLAQAILGGELSAKRGKKGATIFATVVKADGPKSTSLPDCDKKHVIDILVGGKVTVMPPSVHPETQLPYTYIGTPLLDCELGALPVLTPGKLRLLALVVKSQQARVLMAGQTTHNAATSLTATLVAHGCMDDEIEAIVVALLPESYDGDTLHELPELIKSAREKGFGGNVRGSGSLPLDDRVAHIIEERLKPLSYIPGDGFRRYSTGFWQVVSASEIDRLAKEILCEYLKPTQQVKNSLGNVRECLRLNVENEKFGAGMTRVCLTNGALDTETGLLEPHAPEHELRFQLGFDFDPRATCPLYESQLQQTFMGDEKAVQTFEEFAAHTLIPDMRYQKALYLLGEGGSGKSTLLHIVEAMHDPLGVSVTALAKLEGERYLTNVVKRLICISYDTQTNAPIFGESFIRITGGDPVAVRRLYQEVQDLVHPTVRFIGCMNYDMPKFIGSPDALARRLIFLECGARVSNPDLHRTKKLLEERAGILNRWIKALGRLRERGQFDIPEESQNLITEYTQAHNPVEAFVRERLVVDDDCVTPIAEVTVEYNYWAERCGEKATSAMLLGKALRASGVKGGTKMIDGDNVRIVFARIVTKKPGKY